MAPKRRGHPGDTFAARRAGIIDAAAKLIADHGPVDVGIRDIAAEARVSTATVRKYFGTKDRILGALHERMIATRAVLFATMPTDDITAACRLMVDTFYPDMISIFRILNATNWPDADWFDTETMELAADYLKRCTALSVPPSKRRRVAAAWVGAIAYYVLQEALAGHVRRSDLHAHADELAVVLKRAYPAKKGPRRLAPGAEA